MGVSDIFKTTDQIAAKTLAEFKDLEGLDEVVNGILSLKDSKIYEMVYKASKKDPEEMTSYVDTVDDLLKLRQVKLASENLKDPPLYLPFVTDTIISSHFQATLAFIGGINYAYAQKKLNKDSTFKEHIILERLMSLLDDFDRSDPYNAPDKEFYNKLRKIKWDKKSKRLFRRLDDIRGDINYDRWGTGSDVFETGEDFSLTFLAACNAVHQDRNRILKEDVIRAYKTYLKLLNTDISKMEV